MKKTMTHNPSAAPCFNEAAVGLPWWRRALAQGAGYMIPSSAFVAIPFLSVTPDINLPLALAATAGMLFFFLGTTVVAHWGEAARWLWVAGLTTCVGAVGILTDGDYHSLYFVPYATSAVAMLIPWLLARIVIPIMSLLALAWGYQQADMLGVVMALVAFALGWGVGSALDHDRIRKALDLAEQRTAVLAVAAERERIGRDLHDILGHSLTTIAVKIDLAARLVGRDDAAARTEIREVGEITRRALADVRATASGMREVRLVGEVASARSVLTAAGVECVAPSAIPTLSDDRSELFGYTVREAVTNVVRHAQATVCTITVTPTAITVADDGCGIPEGIPHTGLRGLAERVAAAGATLTVTRDAGTTVAVRFKEEA